MSNDKHTVVERHGAAVIQIIIVAVLLWFGTEVTNNGKILVQLTTQINVYAAQTIDHEKRIRSIEITRGREER